MFRLFLFTSAILCFGLQSCRKGTCDCDTNIKLIYANIENESDARSIMNFPNMSIVPSDNKTLGDSVLFLDDSYSKNIGELIFTSAYASGNFYLKCQAKAQSGEFVVKMINESSKDSAQIKINSAKWIKYLSSSPLRIDAGQKIHLSIVATGDSPNILLMESLYVVE
jgi:hypothetical protein